MSAMNPFLLQTVQISKWKILDPTCILLAMNPFLHPISPVEKTVDPEWTMFEKQPIHTIQSIYHFSRWEQLEFISGESVENWDFSKRIISHACNSVYTEDCWDSSWSYLSQWHKMKSTECGVFWMKFGAGYHNKENLYWLENWQQRFLLSWKKHLS